MSLRGFALTLSLALLAVVQSTQAETETVSTRDSEVSATPPMSNHPSSTTDKEDLSSYSRTQTKQQQPMKEDLPLEDLPPVVL